MTTIATTLLDTMTLTDAIDAAHMLELADPALDGLSAEVESQMDVRDQAGSAAWAAHFGTC